jgi:metal-responsive CopG/Arc/MetJ family transcriptional regulator
MQAPTTKTVILRMPEVLAEAIDTAARRKFMTRSELIRQAALEKLANEGVCLVPTKAA